jgi:hypothetical protein
MCSTHGCNTCHTVGENGKLGFTEKGKNLTKGFEGCIRTLTAMNLIAQVPDNQRSPDQRKTAARFNEFGCTLCHKIVPGKMGLTDLGTKLTSLHLVCGCKRACRQQARTKIDVKKVKTAILSPLSLLPWRAATAED